MNPPSVSTAALRRHLIAAFGTTQGLPAYLQEQQRRLEGAIRRGGLEDKLPHLLSGVTDDQRRAEEPFELFVVGEGKFGKSTLVNALLGCQIAPTDFTPKTWCFNRYVATSSPPPYIRVFVAEELRQRQHCPHLDRWLRKPVGTYRSLSEYHISRAEALELSDIEEKSVSATFNRPDAYWSPIMEMEWPAPPDRAIVPGIRLVDTMGINQSVAVPKAHLHYLRWQYERADAVLWLVTYDRLNAEATRAQLHEARRYSKVVYLLITRWDKAANKEELLDRAHELYGSLCTAILPVSALAALAAQGLLAAPASRDEREFAARHRKASPGDLWHLSGFDTLTEALQQFLDGRHRTIRNIQVYSALRQKDREFRQVAIQVRDDSRANMSLYTELRALLSETYERCADQIEERTASSLQGWTQIIDLGLARITYDNRHEAQFLLGADRIIGEFRALQDTLANEIVHAFSKIMAWAASPERSYRSSEFGPTGLVADVALTSSSTVPEVTVPRSELELLVTYSPALWDRFKIGALEVAAWLPIVGGMAQDSLNEAKRREKVKFETEIRRTWFPEIQMKTEQAKAQLLSQAQQIYDLLEQDFAMQYERSGGEAAHQACVDRITAVLERPVVEPVLISVPARLMRHYGWRK